MTSGHVWRSLCLLAALAAALAVTLLNPANVYAATYTTTCPPADAACAALAERLETLTAELESVTANTAIIADNTAGDGPAEIAGTVALSTADRDRLDLNAWGVWFLAGVLLVLLFAPMWHRVWKFWK